MESMAINWQPGNLANDIVRLAPLDESDFERIFEVAADPLIWEQHPTKNRYEKEVFQLYFDGALASKTAFLIINSRSGKIIGCTRYYDAKPGNSSIAIGYTFLSRACWGGLHNRACKKLLLDYAFQFVDKVYFHVGATNLRSQLATRKIGAKKIGEVSFDHYGENQVHYEYLIQKQEWK